MFKQSKRLLYQFILLATFFYPYAEATETSVAAPLALLAAMKNAKASLNYEGTLAILKNGKLDTLQYFHTLQAGVEQERLVSLNSPLREVVRDADKVSCLFKSSQQVVVDHKAAGHSFLFDLPKDLSELTHEYDLIIEPTERVALQAADVLLLKPRDQFRYARKFWIAKQSHLPLKMEVQDFTGETLEQVIFTDLKVTDTPENVQMDVKDKKIQHIHQFENLNAEQLPFNIQSLPTGFKKEAFIRIHLHPSDKVVEQLLLSDGLSSVSIYLEKNPQNFHAGLQSAGAVNSLTRELDAYSLTVMGDVPAATVEFIAQRIAVLDLNP